MNVMKGFLVLSLFLSMSLVCRVEASSPWSVKNGVYTCALKKGSFTVNSMIGGRIVSYRIGEKELLSQPSVHPLYYGATLWVSPQDSWDGPPYEAIDQQPYKADLRGDTLVLTGEVDKRCGLKAIKKFVPWKGQGMTVLYTLVNCGDAPKSFGAWDVCRVAGGVTLFPTGEVCDKLPKSTLDHVSQEGTLTVYRFNHQKHHKGKKLFATAKEGWVAHLADGLFFVKFIPDIRVDELVPGQGEVEIYEDLEGKYIEVENHSRYVTLQPQQSMTYEQQWYLSAEKFSSTDLLPAVCKRVKQLKK